MTDKIISRGITMAVRPPRFALLIDNRDKKMMQSYISGAIEFFAQCWGGNSYILIPTNGSDIDEIHWNALIAYSPDVIGRYIPSLPDLNEADPQRYNELKERSRVSSQLSTEQFESLWDEQITSSSIVNFEISETLSKELINRINPLYFDEHVVSENVFRNSEPSYPLTKIASIVQFAQSPPSNILSIDRTTDKYLDLLILNYVGAITTACSNRLKENNIPTVTHDALNQASEADRVKAVFDASVRSSDTGFYSSIGTAIPLSFMNLTASNISMTGLSNYYQTGVHREDIESVKLIVGDSIDDFCLFYNLSRLHSEVFWLPDAYLKSAHRIVGTDDRFGENESLASHIVNTVNQKIGYGQNDKNVALISASLTGRQLIYRKRWLGEICLIDAHSFVTKVIPTSGQNIALDCVSITMETNNYRNQQDMIFQNNVGVSRLQTPRPKNFTHINPMEHRWMTTFTVEGFTPPPIPGLISKIVSGGHITTHEARITRDGMAYFCPNVIVMNGDDIDTNLIYPRLRLLTDDEMIDDFFVYSGYKTSVSDKGSYFRDSLARFGSLDKLAAFFGKKVHRDLFDKFLLSKQAAQASEDEIVNLENEKQNNNYLSFEVVASTLGDEQNAIRLLDELIESNVIKRGLIFQCELCRRACWYDIAEVQNTFNCKRCEHTQAYSYSHWKSPSQPAWYFKLVEPVYLFYSSNSYLTALALAKIKEKSRLDFHFAGETEIIDSRGRKKELDIVVVSDGKVIIGECKNCTPSSDDISKYIRLYPKLIIKPDHFLLATTSSSVTDEVKKAVASISPSTIYTKADLL